MRAKSYLERVKHLDMIIRQKKREWNELHMTAGGFTGIDYSKDRVQTSCSGDASFTHKVHRIADLEKEVYRLLKEKHRIIDQIQGLKNPDYTDLLYKHYVEYKNLRRISMEMKYSYDHVRHLHGRALQSFNDKYLKSTQKNTL